MEEELRVRMSLETAVLLLETLTEYQRVWGRDDSIWQRYQVDKVSKLPDNVEPITVLTRRTTSGN
ncbi:MAG: hypothetical protein KME64_29110 [Scytonematopsis contorta HA4267-MV1]|jgi:hypothetical protein|nr:hypothetical protein [Scytonematopsis contorta HA4267-MV1]